ncbi:MAG: sulfurtransferase [Saprospirales bacterium]|nr:sulfurtransferase [Saprospirales bacterium]
MYNTLITAKEVLAHLHDPNWVVIDCRFSLQDAPKGREDYLDGHVPGAFYAHLDEDLSAPVVPGKTSRHPMLPVDRMVDLFSFWGIDDKAQVVVYDYKGGGMAVRLWWMLQWLGHEAVALMDGGWANWQAQNYPVSVEAPGRQPRQFIPRLQEGWTMDASAVAAVSQDPGYRVVDSRNYERYIGQEEPIDPVAGHIPGAINISFGENVDEDGFFKAPEVLRQQFEAGGLKGIAPDHVVFYCGSGVTSCHNVLAMLYAGLGRARIYPGSWSEWITDPKRLVSTGE